MASSSASVTPPAPYIHEALPPCHESGRSAVVIAPKPPIDVPAYLDAHDLFDQVTVIAVSVTDVRPPLKPLRPIAYSSQVPQPTSKAAQEAGTTPIGYPRASNDAAHLVDAGATTFVYSMAVLALSLRSSAH